MHFEASIYGNWLLVGAVCKEWLALYADLPEQQLCNFRLDENTNVVTCGMKTTLYSAVVASPSAISLTVVC
jgi:hypothetical protein